MALVLCRVPISILSVLTSLTVRSHQKLQKMQNRQIAQNATLSKIFTAHITLAFPRVCLLGPTPTRDIYIPIGWRSFIAETLLAHLHRVELFSTLIYSFSFKVIAPIALSLMSNKKSMGAYSSKRFTAFGVNVVMDRSINET